MLLSALFTPAAQPSSPAPQINWELQPAGTRCHWKLLGLEWLEMKQNLCLKWVRNAGWAHRPVAPAAPALEQGISHKSLPCCPWGLQGGSGGDTDEQCSKCSTAAAHQLCVLPTACKVAKQSSKLAKTPGKSLFWGFGLSASLHGLEFLSSLFVSAVTSGAFQPF